MAINKKLIHFNTFENFNSKKLSANIENTKYTLGIDGEIQNGSPDILYQSIVYIKDTKQQWTHGQLYASAANIEAVDTSETLNNVETNTYVKYVVQTLTEEQKEQARSNIGVNLTDYAKKSNLSNVATSGSYNDLTNKPTIPNAVTENTVSGWGFTKNTGTYSKPSTGIPKTDLASAVQTSLEKANTALQTETYKGTITGVSANGTSIATSGVANIPAASTSAYGVTKLSSATNSTSTSLAATASAVKAAYDLANGKQDKLVSGTNIKTINGESLLGEGNIVISSGGGEETDMSNYYTKEEIDNTVGDINTILESIING